MAKQGYDEPDCNRFVDDCLAAGLEVEHYRGRFFWEGPAVRVDSIADVTSVTSVRCQHDQMGLGFIVYPVKSGRVVSGDAVREAGDDDR